MTEPLSPSECRARYGQRLQSELDAVSRESADTSDDRKPVELDQQSVGRLSRMDALQGQAMAKAMQARRNLREGVIRAALKRLNGEDFGWCDNCGEFIGVKRLDLDPTIQLCVSCAR